MLSILSFRFETATIIAVYKKKISLSILSFRFNSMYSAMVARALSVFQFYLLDSDLRPVQGTPGAHFQFYLLDS